MTIRPEEDLKTRQPREEKIRQTYPSSRSFAPGPSLPVSRSPSLSLAPSLLQLFDALRDKLANYDKKIKVLKPQFRDFRAGDIPQSLASIEKAQKILEYIPV